MKDDTLTERQIVAAISWWGSCLRNPSRFDNGGRDFANVVASGLAGDLRASVTITPIQVGTFVHALAGILQAGHVDHAGRRYEARGILSTDYHPDAFLAAALDVAGIPDEAGCILPWKTVMWFMDGGVKVRDGYGRPERWILSPTRVVVRRLEPQGTAVYRPATTYWQRRSRRFHSRHRRAGALERLLSHGLRCRSCGLPEYAWQHHARDPGREGAHAFVEPLPAVKWRVVRTAQRAIRDGNEDDLLQRSVRA